MGDLKQCSLDELIERVLRERLIDACEREEDHIVIVQGPMRFVLNPLRAHAFLRGVIKGMSPEYRHSVWRSGDRGRKNEHVDESLATYLPKEGLLKSFRRHLLEKWWTRYRAAGCPFGRNGVGLMLWIRHNTNSTIN